MRLPLLLLLALPLPAVAQYRGFSNINSHGGSPQYQASQRQAQMSADFQRQTMEKRLTRIRTIIPPGPQQQQSATELMQRQAQQVAQQHAAEQHATDGLVYYAQYQDSLRRAHPAANEQLAAAQLQADAQELALVRIKNYRDIFLAGQVLYAEQARTFSPEAMLAWQHITKALLDDAWWAQQEPAHLLEKVLAYRATLVSLTTDLLGFDPATAPKSPGLPSVSSLDATRTRGPLDEQVTTQYLQQAARAEKVANSTRLVRALNDFSRQLAAAAARPAGQQTPLKLRTAVKSGLRDLNKELDRYELEIDQSEALTYAQVTVRNYATLYLPTKDKAPKKRPS